MTINYKTFIDFLSESKKDESDYYDERNKAIDLKNLIHNSLVNFSNAASHPDFDTHKQTLYDHMKNRKTFSTAQIIDNTNVPIGWAKKVFTDAKNVINSKGYGKSSSRSETPSRGERIDNYLKQKQIGRIKK